MSDRAKTILTIIVTVVIAVAFGILGWIAISGNTGESQANRERRLAQQQIHDIREASRYRIDQVLKYAEAQSQEIKRLVAENSAMRAQLHGMGVEPIIIEYPLTSEFYTRSNNG